MAKKAAPKAAEPKAAAAQLREEGQDREPRPRSSPSWRRRPVCRRSRSRRSSTSLAELIKNELGKKGPGIFVVPGLLKLKVVRKPATKAGQRLNPFTKEMMNVPAKPARNVVKALPLKSLKEMV